MASKTLSLALLIERGAAELAHYAGRDRPPTSPLEWLGIAVTRLPELTASARTADDVSGRVRRGQAGIRGPLIDALAGELATAAATIQQARDRLHERHPGAESGGAGVEGYAELVEVAQRKSARRSEMMMGSYASFLGGAIEAAGALADAELSMARGRRWDRVTPERDAELRAGQLETALANALGGLLAYARLVAEDAAQMS
ncbi:MAG: hypothetical protein QOF37_2114 [Thermoleophilaceae bacterium]|nr:hypothetical protein [Thermoleophilaceae bacterium]